MMKNCKLLLFDLDGTLLRSDKTISKRTLEALLECRRNGILLGLATSRGEQNALSFIEGVKPEVLITSGGAIVKCNGKLVYKDEFSKEETISMIGAARNVCGSDCEITIDTVNSHYWNYKFDHKEQYPNWENSVYTDFQNFKEESLKMCVEIFIDGQARRLQEILTECDCKRFSDGYWYKFTKKTATKERAIMEACSALGISPEEVAAFGDDYADIGMLKICGKGIAMGNAVNEVKENADLIIGGNDEDGIAEYLSKINL